MKRYSKRLAALILLLFSVSVADDNTMKGMDGMNGMNGQSPAKENKEDKGPSMSGGD